VKELSGSGTGTTNATREQSLALLEDIDSYPSWASDVVPEAEVLERDAQGQPTKARCKLHADLGPLTRDFNLVMSVHIDAAAGTVKLSRIPHGPTDRERFDVIWQVEGGNPQTRIGLDLSANLSVPRMVPLGGVGDSLAQGLVNAATRELASRT
jgi:Polyketide cyclase / dehydrase and lipid transport